MNELKSIMMDAIFDCDDDDDIAAFAKAFKALCDKLEGKGEYEPKDSAMKQLLDDMLSVRRCVK